MASAAAQNRGSCRFCLRLASSHQNCSSELFEFMEEILLVKITRDDVLVCADCSLMWSMFREFLNTCLLANTILQTGVGGTTKIPSWNRWEVYKPLQDLSKAVKLHHTVLQALVSGPEKERKAEPDRVEKRSPDRDGPLMIEESDIKQELDVEEESEAEASNSATGNELQFVKMSAENPQPTKRIRVEESGSRRTSAEERISIEEPEIKQEEMDEEEESEATGNELQLIKTTKINAERPSPKTYGVQKKIVTSDYRPLPSEGFQPGKVLARYRRISPKTEVFQMLTPEGKVIKVMDNGVSVVPWEPAPGSSRAPVVSKAQPHHQKKSIRDSDPGVPPPSKCQICGTLVRDMASHLRLHIVHRRDNKQSDEPATVVIRLPSQKPVAVVRAEPPRQVIVRPKVINNGPVTRCKVCGMQLLNALAVKNHARMHTSTRRRRWPTQHRADTDV